MARLVMARRRYFLRKQRTAEYEGDDAVALAWQSQRFHEPGTPLPPGFSARSACLRAGYTAMEELDGASIEELRRAGLSLRDATAVFNRIEGIHVATVYFLLGPRAGEAYDQDEVTPIPSSARTASFTTEPYEIGDRSCARLTLDVTDASGTAPTLHVQLQTRRDASDAWRNVDAFPEVSAAGSTRRSFPGCDRQIRFVCDIGGTTPSFTFSLSGEAVG